MRGTYLSVSALSIIFALSLVLAPSQAAAAPWLAPAADQDIKADWVKDVAKAFHKKEYKNVFMNQPFGCDQCRILGFLNNAAEAMEHDQPKLAKSFLHRALNVLEDGIDDGWYSERDIRPIQRLIIKKANQGFKRAEASEMAMSPPRDRGHDPRYEQGRDPLFSLDEPEDYYGDKTDRWSGYTEGHTFGLTERLDASRNRERQDRQAMQPRDRERRMSRDQDDVSSEDTQRRRSQDRDSRMSMSREQDDFYSEDRPRRRSQDQFRQGSSQDMEVESRMTRKGRDRFPDDMSTEEALEALMEEEEAEDQDQRS
jgi:hypothetical protein